MSYEKMGNSLEKRELPPKINFGEMIEDFADGKDVKLVRNYADARKLIQDEDFKADIIFLDNNLVAEPIDQTGREKNTLDDDLKKFDPEGFDLYNDPHNFSDLPFRNGYELIDIFKKKGCIVVGTSSMSDSELRSKGLSIPDYQIKKTDIKGESMAEFKKKLIEK